MEEKRAGIAGPFFAYAIAVWFVTMHASLCAFSGSEPDADVFLT